MRQPKIHPDAFVGLVDAVLTLGVIMANAGLLSRAELAAAFGEADRQLCEGGASDARRAAVCSISEFLKLPVAGDRHLEVIDGGRAELQPKITASASNAARITTAPNRRGEPAK
jgi:hypothetical protein